MFMDMSWTTASAPVGRETEFWRSMVCEAIFEFDALAFTRDYLVAFDAATAASKTAKELIARIKARFPDTRDVLDDFILPNSAKVATGEAAPWTE